MLHEKINLFIQISRKHIITYLGISISVFLFVIFFQPFTPLLLEFDNKLLFFAGFTIISLFFLFLLQIIFQRPLLREDNYFIKNTLILSTYYLLFIIFNTVAYVFYLRFVGNIHITFTLVIRSIVISAGVSACIQIVKRIACLQNEIIKLSEENRRKNDQLQQFSENYVNQYIELTSEFDTGVFRVLLSELVYIKAADNYIEVGYLDSEVIKKKLLRNTLKNAEKQLSEYNNFIRTHRSCIVNIENVEKLHKNFNTYWLSLTNSKETIPVSRHYLLSVKALFQ